MLCGCVFLRNPLLGFPFGDNSAWKTALRNCSKGHLLLFDFESQSDFVRQLPQETANLRRKGTGQTSMKLKVAQANPPGGGGCRRHPRTTGTINAGHPLPQFHSCEDEDTCNQCCHGQAVYDQPSKFTNEMNKKKLAPNPRSKLIKFCQDPRRPWKLSEAVAKCALEGLAVPPACETCFAPSAFLPCGPMKLQARKKLGVRAVECSESETQTGGA